MTDPLWLSRDSARVKVFNRESQERNATIKSLSEKGIDIAQARQISDQIDAKRSELESALRNKQGEAMTKFNTGIKTLNQQFRNTVGTYQTNLEIQMKSAAIQAMAG
jgi:predicted phage tail protein